MWRPKLEHEPDAAGTPRPIGWIVVDESGQPYQEHRFTWTAFKEEVAQAQADQLNARAD